MTLAYDEVSDARPLMYIDQNIIDGLRKERFSFEPHVFNRDFRAVYSDETLREIKRAEDGGGDSSEYLRVLSDINAFHLRQNLSEKFELLNNATLQTASPWQIYSAFTENLWLDDFVEAQTLINQKIMGGLPEQSWEDIARKMVEVYVLLDESVIKSLDTVKEASPELGQLIFEHRDSLGGDSLLGVEIYRESVQKLVEGLKNNLNDDRSEQSVIDAYRSELRLRPKELNNLKPPNVVEQVWQVISADEAIQSSGIDMHRYFGINSVNPAYPHRNFYASEQVANIYLQLNLAGYFADEKLHQERGFRASNSDMNHVAMATYCNYLISNDMRLLKKAAAAYDCLDINTEIIDISAK